MTTSRDFRQFELLSSAENETVSNAGVEVQNARQALTELPNEAPHAQETDHLQTAALDEAPASIGSRLRAGRESRGWTCEEVGARLKLQARLIRKLEQDDFTGISHAVYLRGYLTSYARLLDMPVDFAERVVEEVSEPATLVSTGRVSRSRYLLDRYSVSATYLILTGLVIGPAVWLATHGGLEQNLARTVMLDEPAKVVSQESASTVDAPPQVSTSILVGPPAPPATPIRNIASEDAQPIVASMAPFASSPATVSPTPIVDDHSLTLKLAQASWVEITSADGEKLEYSLLQAGVERTYSSDQAMTIRIGNAGGAIVVADGQEVDLAPYQRANVAHLRVFADGQLATRAEL
jgi:cytoskeleton protein RodZ